MNRPSRIRKGKMQTIVSIQNEKQKQKKQHIKQIEEQNRFISCMRQSNSVYDFHFMCFTMRISNARGRQRERERDIARNCVIYVCVCVRVSVSTIVKKNNRTNEKINIFSRDETKTRTVEIKWAELAYLCHKLIQCYILLQYEQQKKTFIVRSVYCLQAVSVLCMCQLLSILKPHFSPCLHNRAGGRSNNA